jgi:hypothetical protein
VKLWVDYDASDVVIFASTREDLVFDKQNTVRRPKLIVSPMLGNIICVTVAVVDDGDIKVLTVVLESKETHHARIAFESTITSWVQTLTVETFVNQMADERHKESYIVSRKVDTDVSAEFSALV